MVAFSLLISLQLGMSWQIELASELHGVESAGAAWRLGQSQLGQLESTEGSLTFSSGTCAKKTRTERALGHAFLFLDIRWISIWSHWCKCCCFCTTVNCSQVTLHHQWLSESGVQVCSHCLTGDSSAMWFMFQSSSPENQAKDGP